MLKPFRAPLLALTTVALFLAGCETASKPTALENFSPDDVFDISQITTGPEPTFQKKPVYPAAQRRAGVSGQALVDFIVDRQGTVRNAHAVRATHENFAAAAVESVSAWKFRPGLKSGQPVFTHIQVPIVFTLNEGTVPPLPPAPPLDPNDDSVPIYEPGRVDVPPEMISQIKPVYPRALRASRTSGEALVDFIVDEKGVVRNACSKNETHREFGAAAVAAVAQWKYSPGMNAGKPVRTHFQIPFVFTLDP